MTAIPPPPSLYLLTRAHISNQSLLSFYNAHTAALSQLKARGLSRVSFFVYREKKKGKLNKTVMSWFFIFKRLFCLGWNENE